MNFNGMLNSGARRISRSLGALGAGRLGIGGGQGFGNAAMRNAIGQYGIRAGVGAAAGMGANFAYNMATGREGGYMGAAFMGGLAGAGSQYYRMNKGNAFFSGLRNKYAKGVSALAQNTSMGKKVSTMVANAAPNPVESSRALARIPGRMYGGRGIGTSELAMMQSVREQAITQRYLKGTRRSGINRTSFVGGHFD